MDRSEWEGEELRGDEKEETVIRVLCKEKLCKENLFSIEGKNKLHETNEGQCRKQNHWPLTLSLTVLLICRGDP